MKKYIQSMMAFAAIVSFASCSSEDNNTTIENESATKVMTFTATQEGDEQSTRAAISTSDSKVINWEEGDQISIFDGKTNNQFTLKNGKGTPNATFTGEALESGSYAAVYPYQSTASLSGNDVTNVTLPATQNATANSFDKNAALMMAKSDNTTLTFKNVVGYVKVKPNFDCKRIELMTFDNSAVLAGTGTVSYNNGEPKLDLSNAETKNDAITLTGDIKAGNFYYIAVPPVTLKAGWTIQFTASDGKEYSRKGTKPITFTRNMVTDLGEFATDGDYWAGPRGIVDSDQEVDMGVFGINGKNFRLIFAKSNLTKDGLAANEYDYGDYFAWGAIKPWYTEINKTSSPWTVTWEKSGGYSITNAPFYNSSTNSYTKYTAGDALEASDDAARQILKGDWRIPTTEIWAALVNNSTKVWDSTNKGYKFTKNSQTLFLPAAGYVWETSFYNVGSSGRYWSGTTASLKDNADYLHFDNVHLNAQDMGSRSQGFPVRPVRLVEVSQSQQ